MAECGAASVVQTIARNRWPSGVTAYDRPNPKSPPPIPVIVNSCRGAEAGRSPCPWKSAAITAPKLMKNNSPTHPPSRGLRVQASKVATCRPSQEFQWHPAAFHTFRA